MSLVINRHFKSFYCYESFSIASAKLFEYESAVRGYHYAGIGSVGVLSWKRQPLWHFCLQSSRYCFGNDSWSSTNGKFKSDKSLFSKEERGYIQFWRQLINVNHRLFRGAWKYPISLKFVCLQLSKIKNLCKFMKSLLPLFTTNLKKPILWVLSSRTIWKLKVVTGKKK